MNGDIAALMIGCAAFAVFVISEIRIKQIRARGRRSLIDKYSKGGESDD
jgi:hypothetical protein